MLSELVLYVDAKLISPYAMSVFVGLHEKELPFKLLTVDLTRHAHHEAEFAAKSLTCRVPTLLHDGFALSESSAITEYLDDVFPEKPLYPTDAKLRARARQIQAWLRSDLMPIREERPTEVIFYQPSAAPISADANKAAEKLFRVAEALIPSKGENLFGEWCIADADLALMLNRLILNGDQVPQKLSDYASYQWQRPSIQLWAQLNRPVL